MGLGRLGFLPAAIPRMYCSTSLHRVRDAGAFVLSQRNLARGEVLAAPVLRGGGGRHGSTQGATTSHPSQVPSLTSHPLNAASSAAISIFFICIIAAKARSVALDLGFLNIFAMPVCDTCHDRP